MILVVLSSNVNALAQPNLKNLSIYRHGSHFGTFSLWPNMKTTDDYDKRPVKKGEMELKPKVNSLLLITALAFDTEERVVAEIVF